MWLPWNALDASHAGVAVAVDWGTRHSGGRCELGREVNQPLRVQSAAWSVALPLVPAALPWRCATIIQLHNTRAQGETCGFGGAGAHVDLGDESSKCRGRGSPSKEHDERLTRAPRIHGGAAAGCRLEKVRIRCSR